MRIAFIFLLLMGISTQDAKNAERSIPLAECPNTPRATLTEVRQALQEQGFQPIANLDQVWAFATGETDGSNLPEESNSSRAGLTMGKDDAEGWIRRNIIADFDAAKSGMTRSCHMFNEMLAAKDNEFDDLQSANNTFYVCFEDNQFFVLKFRNPVQSRWKHAAQPSKRSQGSDPNEHQEGSMTFKSFVNGIEDEIQIRSIDWTRLYEDDSSDYGKSLRYDYPDAKIDSSEVSLDIARSKTTRTITIRRSTLRFVDHFFSTSEKNGENDSFDKTGYCSAYPK
jgi:hypothetical protein